MKTGRNASVDLLRLVGAVGIVLFHTGLPGAWIGLSALPMFVTLVLLFGLDRPLDHHARRLLVPWIIWSAVFGIAKLGQALVTGAPLGSEFAPWMVVTGLSLHLWFLSFVFLCLVVARCVLPPLPRAGLWGGAVAASCLAIWACNALNMPTPLPQWCSVIPAAFAGVLIARGERAAVVLGLLAAGPAVAIMALDWQTATWQLVIAALATLGALSLPLRSTVASAWAAGVALGVYLVHPLVYAAALYALPRYSWGLFVATVIGSLLLTMLLRRVAPRIV